MPRGITSLGAVLTEHDEDWQRRAHKALEMLRQKRVAADILIRNRRLAGHLYPDEFVKAAESDCVQDSSLVWQSCKRR